MADIIATGFALLMLVGLVIFMFSTLKKLGFFPVEK
jgi:hypothetical protein